MELSLLACQQVPFRGIGLKEIAYFFLTLSLSESIMETCSVVLTFESVDEILWCDHSNETSSAVLLHATICYLIFFIKEFFFFLNFYVWRPREIKI